MRILHLVAYSLWSGPVPAVAGLAKAQRRLGHDVSLWYDTKRGIMQGYEEEARDHLQRDFREQPLTLSTKSNPVEWIRDCLKLREFIGDKQPDILHVHLSHDHFLARSVVSQKGTSPRLVRTIHSRRPLTNRLGQKVLFKGTAGVILRSDDHRSRFELHYAGSGATSVIPSGVDLDRFRPLNDERRAQIRQSLGLPPDAVVICHAGLISNRGQTELLEAVQSQERDNVWILYLGRGDGETELRSSIAKVSIRDRIRCLGYLSGDDLVGIYNASDLAFVGRLGNDAGGRIALEPMACQTPIFGNNDGALEDIFDSDRGWPCREFISADIGAALRRALEAGPSVMAEKGLNARAWVNEKRNFRLEAQSTNRFYEDLIS